MRTIAMVMALALAAGLTGCGGGGSSGRQAGGETGNGVTTDDAGTRVALRVTEEGFVPARVEVPSGKPVTLVVTRTTERTCATELVLKEHGIHQKLPLNQPVEIRFTPSKPGELTYACGMDMIKGTIAVQ